MMATRFLIRLLPFLAPLWALSACAPLPDVSPFATATRQVASAVRTSGDTAVSVVAEAYSPARAEDLRAAWEVRDSTMDALVRYSNSLVAIVQGHNDARGSAATLGRSVEDLATAAGLIAPGGGPAVGIAKEVFTLVTAQIQGVKAARSLEDALRAAQPVVDAAAEHLGRRLVRARAGDQPSNDVTDLAALFDGAESKVQTEQLAATQATADLIAVVEGRLTSLQASINAGTPAAVAEAAQLSAAAAAADAKLAMLNKPFEERLARIRAARELAEQLAVAIDAWATAHADLTAAMAQRRPVSVESLLDSAIEIRTLIRRIGEL